VLYIMFTVIAQPPLLIPATTTDATAAAKHTHTAASKQVRSGKMHNSLITRLALLACVRLEHLLPGTDKRPWRWHVIRNRFVKGFEIVARHVGEHVVFLATQRHCEVRDSCG
jgi:hypothetical protein